MLLEAGAFRADPWRHLGDDEALPEDEAATVSHARWLRERAALGQRSAALGLRLPNDVSPLTLGDEVHRFALIALSFPRFTDGRAYSQARLLRGRLGYRGSLRAAGNVLRDQLLFMRRCGFDSFEVGERALAENWLAAFDEVDVFFQPTEDQLPWVLRQRRAPA